MHGVFQFNTSCHIALSAVMEVERLKQYHSFDSGGSIHKNPPPRSHEKPNILNQLQKAAECRKHSAVNGKINN
jgi:hypothetical protein